jgi:IS5 family transposase
LKLLQEQTLEKLTGNTHIKNRIVSLDEPDARPIKKGKRYPECEFGTTQLMTFNRDGFMITVDTFIGNPSDKTLYPEILTHYIQRMKDFPDAVITDKGFCKKANKDRTQKVIHTVFMGRSTDVSEDQMDFCRSARSATEGFIAVAKNFRGFDCSLYRRIEGDRIWSMLCQIAYNLKKFLQLYQREAIEEDSLVSLGLLV